MLQKLFLSLHSVENKNDVMAQKKVRADNTYMINSKRGMNPKLGAKILSDGRDSLFLDFYRGYEKVERNGKLVNKADRPRETLELYIYTKPRTAQEREINRATLQRAEEIRYEREQEEKQRAKGYCVRAPRKVNVIADFEAYIEAYTKKDIRNMKIALQRFKDFLHDTPKYAHYASKIAPEQVTKELVREFADYLQGRSVGEGARTIFARFKKYVKYATGHDIFYKNPCDGVVIRVDDKQITKDILSEDEIGQLIATRHDKENPDIRRAFIFCLYTGLRFCDVKDLTYGNVDFPNGKLKFEQSKTKGHSASSRVIIPLKPIHLELIGMPRVPQDKQQRIFELPSYEMCLKALKRWVKRAGIDKHISWHCARHSFAVNILSSGTDIKTLASLLGHSGLKHTEKYTREIDSLRDSAMDRLRVFEL